HRIRRCGLFRIPLPGAAPRKSVAMTRAEKINTAVTRAAELIGMLSDEGEITPGQARILIAAAVKGAVRNPPEYEIINAARRVKAELETALAGSGLIVRKEGE